ncbi:MAG: radical SAM protein, partial [Acidimicrobiales bacterium]
MSAPPTMPVERPASAPSYFHVMAKPTGAICNLDCSYCFYLDKEALYPDARFRMREEVAKAYIQQVVEAHRGASEVTIAWQGGEPTLMGLAFFASMVSFAESVVGPGQHVTHTLQTNGTLLSDDWAQFLAEKRFLVGISIDGPSELH